MYTGTAANNVTSADFLYLCANIINEIANNNIAPTINIVSKTYKYFVGAR